MPIPDRLETDRLIIRPFEPKDFDAFKTFMQSEDATRYLLFSAEQKTAQGIRELFVQTIASYTTDEPVFSLAVAEKTTDFLLGSVGMAPDFESEDTQIYWSIHPTFWKRGYATESTRALIRYAFEVLDIDCIAAYSHPRNLASVNVVQKVGMKAQGTVKLDGFDIESVCYKITKKEFGI